MTEEKSNKRWVIPVEKVYEDYYISFPDDLLEAADLKEGDEIEWISLDDGSFELRKVKQ